MLRSSTETKKAAYYYRDPLSSKMEINPLFIGCEGGKGHNAANDAIRMNLIADGLIDEARLAKHTPMLHSEKNDGASSNLQLNFGLKLTHDIPVLSSSLQWFLKKSSLPVLPDAISIKKEIEKLENSQLGPNKEKKDRYYIDMLLDVYPSGYENAAIWNILQKNDATDELNKLIKLQSYNDANNHTFVRDSFIKKLIDAAKNKKPFSEIICTQAMGLPALCDAVQYYNNHIEEYPNAYPIKINLFMTDFPNEAIHFCNSLQQLTPSQSAQMYLYGVNLSDSISEKFGLENKGFAGIFSIDPQNNPMVRPGFRDKSLHNISFSEQITLPVQVTGSKDQEYSIEENEKIATVILGSQAANDTIKYVKELVNSGLYKKIFVFGGTSPHLEKDINEIIKQNLNSDITVIPLDNQDDIHMAPILTRSNLIITRAGGLSMMEQAAMPHNKGQTILIHCKTDSSGALTSGIRWEDGNADEFINAMEKSGTTVKRTSVDRVTCQLNSMKENTFSNDHHNVTLNSLDTTSSESLKEETNLKRSTLINNLFSYSSKKEHHNPQTSHYNHMPPKSL